MDDVDNFGISEIGTVFLECQPENDYWRIFDIAAPPNPETTLQIVLTVCSLSPGLIRSGE